VVKHSPRIHTLRRIVCAVFLAIAFGGVAVAQSDWKRDWDTAVGAAQAEGQVTVYAPPGKQYQDALAPFQDAYPRIKLNYVPGSGTNNSQRLLAERRAGKYLADVFVSGSGTAPMLAKSGVFEPLPPVLMLPENKNPSHWFEGRHQFADPQNQFVFIMQGNVDTSIGAYNTQRVNPKEVKSHRDILNPKWKGRMVAYDPRERGHVQTMRGIYYNPLLGGEFLRRLFSEMDVTLGRDQRQMIDWVGGGKFDIFLFAANSDADEAAKKGLPVGLLDSPPEEGYMSGGFGHVGFVNKAPRPNAARIFINWLLSKKGQLQWQAKTDNNSLRIDIPKDMLTDQRSVPRPGVKYLIASLPQYEDVSPIVKIVNDALAKRG
jgi:iron(III) transport system substrate-binding protein